MLEHIITVKDKIEHIMGLYPETRDNDMLLFLAYLSIFHDLKHDMCPACYALLKRIMLDKDTPKFESITRARRLIQENGCLQGELRFERLVEEDKIRKAMAVY